MVGITDFECFYGRQIERSAPRPLEAPRGNGALFPGAKTTIVAEMNGRTMRVVQCWDDGVEDDIRLCEILRTHGAKATFNLNPGLHQRVRGHTWVYQNVKEVKRLARGELRDVYDGFLIANHTVSHPRPLKISPGEWRREVFDGRKQLQDLFDQPVEGFVYPYGQRNEATDEVVREAGHIYARGTGGSCSDAPAGHPPADPLRFVPDAHFKDPHIREKFAAARARHAPVFYFWGHSYELMDATDWQSLEDFIRHISASPDCEWAWLPDLFRPRAA